MTANMPMSRPSRTSSRSASTARSPCSPTRQAKGPGGRGAAAAPLKELGDHPDGGAITVKDGKYGPYVNWGKVNATLPKGKDPQSVIDRGRTAADLRTHRQGWRQAGQGEGDQGCQAQSHKGCQGRWRGSHDRKAEGSTEEKGCGQAESCSETEGGRQGQEGLTVTRTPRDRPDRPGKPAARLGRAAKSASATDDKTVIIHGAVPPRDILMRFLAENPDKASKRDIAKAFGLKSEARVELKALLRELEADGLLEKKRKTLVRPGALPPVTVLDITTRDKDGELIGRPAEWPEDAGVAPAVAIRQSTVGKSKGKTPVGGLGDRVLAKIFPAKDRAGPAYTARIIKVLDRRVNNNAALGVFRATPGGGGTNHADRQAWRGIAGRIAAARSKPRMAIWSRWKSRALAASACRARR